MESWSTTSSKITSPTFSTSIMVCTYLRLSFCPLRGRCDSKSWDRSTWCPPDVIPLSDDTHPSQMSHPSQISHHPPMSYPSSDVTHPLRCHTPRCHTLPQMTHTPLRYHTTLRCHTPAQMSHTPSDVTHPDVTPSLRWHTPLSDITPPSDVIPLLNVTHPLRCAPQEAEHQGIRSMSGRYASYWNAYWFVFLRFKMTTNLNCVTSSVKKRGDWIKNPLSSEDMSQRMPNQIR